MHIFLTNVFIWFLNMSLFLLKFVFFFFIGGLVQFIAFCCPYLLFSTYTQLLNELQYV